MSRPVITLLSDFGLADPFVGIMKGVILNLAPEVPIVDLSHLVSPQNVVMGALRLRSAVPYFGPGAVHVAVVDPGVGSSRRALVIETEKGLLVGPDNGLLTLAAEVLGRRCVRSIENPRFMRSPVSPTFHGRDVFAPVAALLASGLDPAEVGPVVDTIVELGIPRPKKGPTEVRGEVIYVDGFGNLVTNIDAATVRAFPARDLYVSIESVLLLGLSTTYADVGKGEAVAVIGSWDFLEIAVRNGSAARKIVANVGTPVSIALAGRA